jgi:homoserine kinase
MDIEEAMAEIKRLKGLLQSGMNEEQMAILYALGDALHQPHNKENRARSIEMYYRIMDMAKYRGDTGG